MVNKVYTIFKHVYYIIFYLSMSLFCIYQFYFIHSNIKFLFLLIGIFLSYLTVYIIYHFLKMIFKKEIIKTEKTNLKRWYWNMSYALFLLSLIFFNYNLSKSSYESRKQIAEQLHQPVDNTNLVMQIYLFEGLLLFFVVQLLFLILDRFIGSTPSEKVT